VIACKSITKVEEQTEKKSVKTQDTIQQPTSTESEGIVYNLQNGLIITIDNKNIKAKTADTEHTNNYIIRLMDENEDCPSEGFIDIVHKDEYFTIEQQNCSGWSSINEYITFRYTIKEDRIDLHKFGVIYIDRRNPEEKEELVFSEKDFGKIQFSDVHIDSLYLLLRN